jgi:hypothetical protein
MNAEELVEEVLRIIVQDPAFDEPLALRFINRAQLFAAERILMPALSGGSGFVTTVTDGTEVELPDDFHRELYSATINGNEIEIFANKGLAFQALGHGPKSGSVACCAVDRTFLFYMDVPAVPVQIDLLYYRNPVPMTIDPESFPDGMNRQSDIFDTFIISYACWKIYQEIEQGLEGKKIDTMYNKALVDQTFEELLASIKESRPRRKSKQVKAVW